MRHFTQLFIGCLFGSGGSVARRSLQEPLATVGVPCPSGVLFEELGRKG
jgi:hypothetical protein